MAQITTLHELAHSGLRELASKRVMPGGWDRALNRRAETMTIQLHGLLPAVVSNVADTLMARPTTARWVQMLEIAAQERLLKEMVARWVQLLATEPQVDQQTACALATAREHVANAHRLLSTLEQAATEIGAAQVIVAKYDFSGDVSLSALHAAVVTAKNDVLTLQRKLARYQSSLEEDLEFPA